MRPTAPQLLTMAPSGQGGDFLQVLGPQGVSLDSRLSRQKNSDALGLLQQAHRSRVALEESLLCFGPGSSLVPVSLDGRRQPKYQQSREPHQVFLVTVISLGCFNFRMNQRTQCHALPLQASHLPRWDTEVLNGECPAFLRYHTMCGDSAILGSWFVTTRRVYPKPSVLALAEGCFQLLKQPQSTAHPLCTRVETSMAR